MKTFKDQIQQLDWKTVTNSIYEKTSADVEVALAKARQQTPRDLNDFKALISPAAAPYLEEMAQLSKQFTQQRFGKTLQMYIPLYLSNACQNICTYCGFSMNVDIPRKVLTDKEILAEVEVIKSYGYDHVLLVTGEANKEVGVEYLKNAVKLLKPHFANISIEVQPLSQEDYETLIEAGINTVLVYQETYHEENYKIHHLKGKKSNYSYRLDTHDRLGRAGIHKMGLGVLIGLEDWRTDSFFCATHLEYLERNYWKTKYTLSFPRLRPNAGNNVPLLSVMSDRELLQLICAYRILDPEVELSLSTREAPKFRDHIIPLGITSVSADSKTDPGGYANPEVNLEQFEINDKRPTSTFVEVIRKQGYEPVFKDWDMVLQE